MCQGIIGKILLDISRSFVIKKINLNYSNSLFKERRVEDNLFLPDVFLTSDVSHRGKISYYHWDEVHTKEPRQTDKQVKVF
jgi:hypothetical protein